MRRLSFFSVILLLLVATGCRRTGMRCGPVPGALTGKLVIDGACGHYVVQITGGTYDPGKVAGNWTIPASGVTYTNVFTVMDPCTFAEYNIRQGQSFTFRFAAGDSTKLPNCIACFVAVETPSVSNSINDIMPLP